ncbi:helix-turn-helix transcriptional regulator [Diaphorobacter sp. HDW4A]|uniref:helix-turn-helix transcriptional regulator n=1 Tax=Diaphorobacter sp. HDW4A TaxID=2714924 RepID=UPI001407C4DE|nr:helix-turn-helix transcriptional regulator [Diaphorobacter sp. HDW4A]QIL80201.1 helix-turn-helix transcriptional regulator [Diaphorobacter sp. HDW4A]
MMESTFARMSFATYTSPSMACVLKDVPVFDKAIPARPVTVQSDFVSAEQFSQLTSLLYEAAMDTEGWRPFLDQLRKLLSGNYASLIVRPCNADDVGLIVSAAGERREIPSGNPKIAMSPFRGLVTDRVVTVNDVMSDSEWRASAYYTDWCKDLNVYHVLAADVATKDGCVYGLRIVRPESDVNFNKQEKDFCSMVLPHLKRALNLHLAVNQDRQVISLYSRAMAQLMVGVVILDQNGVVIETNPAATGILDMQDGLKVTGGMLEANYANDNRKLQRLIRDALMHTQVSRLSMTEGMSVSRQSGQLNWGVVVQSISPDEWTEGKQRPSVAVFVRDTGGKADPPVKLAQQLFQLTPAETSLAIQLANGLSLEEAAEALNIRRNTARAHLRSIFSKTGVRRQTELVRIFLNSVAWLGNK